MSKIEWTDKTWNPVVGCSLASPGCTNCYAMKMASRLERMGVAHYAGLTAPSKAGAVWTGKIAHAPEHILTAPLRWRKPQTIFPNSMGDLFHEDVPDEWIDQSFGVMALCPQHTFMPLTKRSRRMLAYVARGDDEHGSLIESIADIGARFMEDGDNAHDWLLGMPWPLPNVWLGTSVEDRARKHRIDDLRETPAAVRFLSFEPLLEDLGEIDLTGIHWVIVGGESGSGARVFQLQWARSIIKQCQAAGVPVFMKQVGAYATDGRGQLHFSDRKGGTMDEWPEDLRVREFPKVAA